MESGSVMLTRATLIMEAWLPSGTFSTADEALLNNPTNTCHKPLN